MSAVSECRRRRDQGINVQSAPESEPSVLNSLPLTIRRLAPNDRLEGGGELPVPALSRCWWNAAVPRLADAPSCSSLFEIEPRATPTAAARSILLRPSLEAPVIEPTLTHQGLQARAPPQAPASGPTVPAT